jgi:hypothetical protein
MAYRLAPLTPIFSLALLACGGADSSEAGASKHSDSNGDSAPGGYGASSPGGSAGSSAAAGGTATIGGATGGSSSSGTAGGAGTSGTAGAATSGGTGGTSAGGTAGTSGDAGSGGSVQPGTLTAGAWDDNRNYDFFASYRNAIRQSGRAGLLPFTDAEYDDAFDAFMGQLSARETLDVALVIDTTGSMGDEMLYLRTEFLALSSSIASAYPNAEQRWSLVVYKDQGDIYVARSFDFTSDLETFQATLAQQSAGGGGDTPEAPDAALAATAELDWRTGGATARLAFWVADAPHHDARAAAMADAVRAVRDAGVHLYPVASSGIDELTEHSMRSAAQLTGGRYLFLTDDSGVGNSHKEPTIPCYFVTRLDDAILRMVDIELSGVYHEPTSAEVIRTGGNPAEGSCTLTSGDIVFAY